MSRELKDLELIAKIETDSKDVLFEHIKENEKDFEEVDIKVSELYNKVENIQLIPGEKGDKGDKGDTGEKGDKPIVGVDFFLPKDGKDGYTPIKGIDYFDGENGKDGKDGEKGEKGDKPKHRWKGTQLQFEKPDGTWGKLIDLKGEKGSQGFMGESLGASYPSVHFNNNLITTGVRDINFSGSGVDVQVSGTKVNVSVTGGDLSGYVPYTGATSNVDLGSNSLILGDYTLNNATGISTATGGLIINGATGFTAQLGGSNIITANGTATELSYGGNSFLRRDSAGTKLTTLTSNGFVKTSGGTGLLSIDTSTYLTSSTATLQVVTTAGATASNAITLEGAGPQLILGRSLLYDGQIKFLDSDTSNFVTVTAGKHTTASYTVQWRDHAAGTVNPLYGNGDTNQVAYFSSSTGDIVSHKSFSYASGTPALTIGNGDSNPQLLFSQKVGASTYSVAFRASSTTTATVTYSLPPTKPASVTQLMTMDTSGNMGLQSGTANRVLFWGATNSLSEDADFTFNTDTLTVTKIAATTYTGTQTYTAVNLVFDATTGSKLGTATSQKIGFWNATPIVQPTTAVAEAAFVENAGGTAVNVDSTFGGYTLQQVVKALQNIGLLA